MSSESNGLGNSVTLRLYNKELIMATTPSSYSADNPYVFNKSLDQILESLPMGSVERAIANNLYGINFRQTGNAVPRAKDQYGFVFFTRPQLNMTQINLTNYRGFYNLLNTNKVSYHRYVRNTLDPRLSPEAYPCPFVDPYNVFIPALTNNAISISGWPDLTVPVYTSHAGLYGEEHSMVDGVTNNYEAFDMDVSFRNTRGNPLIYLFYIWIKYQTLVVEGILNPYMDMVTENEIDYNTRIYRVVLDPSKRYVTQVACTGASFPVNVPTGNLFDYNIDTPYNNKNAEINIRFRCMGFMAFDDIIKFYFNKATAIFNPDMAKLLDQDMASNGTTDAVLRENPTLIYYSPGGGYFKIPYSISLVAETAVGGVTLGLNHKAVPYINLYTNELEWWTATSDSTSASLANNYSDLVDSWKTGNDDDANESESPQ